MKRNTGIAAIYPRLLHTGISRVRTKRQMKKKLKTHRKPFVSKYELIRLHIGMRASGENVRTNGLIKVALLFVFIFCAI